MRELTRGFVAAALEQAGADGSLAKLASDLIVFESALVRSDELRQALTDGSIPVGQRRAVVRDLLQNRAADASAVVAFVLIAERATDLPVVLGQVSTSVREESDRVAEGAPVVAEPSGGRWAATDRLRGYAEFVLARVESRAEVARVEDDLFRLARVVESRPELAEALVNAEVPVGARMRLVDDLLRSKASPASVGLVKYQLRAGRVRDMVRSLDSLVELAAAEQGRRLAEVRAPEPLDDSEKSELSAALALMVGRPVEVRVIVDPAMIGGMLVRIGDTLIDGTVRRRLEQLRESLDTSAWTAA